MDKELFKTLQELKLDVNSIDLKYFDNKIKEYNIEEEKKEDLFRFHNKEYFLLKLKFYILNVLTLGINYSNNKYDYNLRKELLEGALDKVEEEYDKSLLSIAFYETLKEVKKSKENVLNYNIDQLNRFLDLVENLSKEEKMKIFNYKMIPKKEKFSKTKYINALKELRSSLEYKSIRTKRKIEQRPFKEDVSVSDNINTLIMAIYSASIVLCISNDNYNSLKYGLIISAIANLIYMLIDEINYKKCMKPYDEYEKKYDKLNEQLDKLSIGLDFIESCTSNELERYLKYTM